MPGFAPQHMIGRTIVGASLVTQQLAGGVVEHFPVLELDNGALIVARDDGGVRLEYVPGRAARSLSRVSVLQAEMLAALARYELEQRAQGAALRATPAEVHPCHCPHPNSGASYPVPGRSGVWLCVRCGGAVPVTESRERT